MSSLTSLQRKWEAICLRKADCQSSNLSRSQRLTGRTPGILPRESFMSDSTPSSRRRSVLSSVTSSWKYGMTIGRQGGIPFVARPHTSLSSTSSSSTASEPSRRNGMIPGTMQTTTTVSARRRTVTMRRTAGDGRTPRRGDCGGRVRRTTWKTGQACSEPHPSASPTLRSSP